MFSAFLMLAATTINLNQLGFRPADRKQAVIAAAPPAALDWQVVDAGGAVVLRGRTTPGADDPVSGDRVHHADLTALATPGAYRLRVAGVDSGTFRIGRDIYAPLARNALSVFYQQRAGTPIEARFVGARWARAAGHAPEIAACFSGPDQKGNRWPGCPAPRDVTGGWYDAGDHGKYVVNAGIAVWTLQNLYETGMARRLFADGEARLPEAGNGHDDLLDEARWEIEWMLRMQLPAATRMALPIGPTPDSGRLVLTPVDASGMAFQKVADARWTTIPTAPAADREPRLLYPPSTAATLNLAAAAAQAARLWRPIDPAFAARCLAAARLAWDAAARNPAIFAVQSFTGSGGYGDTQLGDERAWAAAELFATTGEAQYRAALPLGPVTTPGWADVAPLGTITLATAAGVPAAIRAAARARIVAAADGFLAETARSGYRIPYAATAYSWGSNATILNRAMLLGLAARFTGAPRYRAGAVDAADYVLGRNPLGQSYVSGAGWKPLRNPHHRFWAHQADPAFPPPPPGVLSGGPNNTAMADPVALRLKGRCAPQRCWADDINAYALNEMAINWNAPLVWVAAYLDAD
ncbi:glycoside hydrolase family 9 protein [Sphingomonas montana]|uniref:glycoside hydrolase family 9 protein n=1 Tax=Sphingomonas montana TaxID=1843236 RepID=UPI00096C9D55|nr:glycoside hydrolase family 9 protein [Sphingomonas montana]